MAYRILAAAVLALALTSSTASSEWQECEPCSCAPTDYGLRADCEGKRVTEIPPTLPENVTALRLSGTAIGVLRNDSLSKYKHLTDLNIHGDHTLAEIQGGAFDNNEELSALVITLCPKLTKIASGVFTKFQRLRFINLERNGLTSVPDFSAFENLETSTPVSVDLDYNKIALIPARGWCRSLEGDICSPAIYVSVSIRDNVLEDIHGFAFAGAKIMSLDFSQNPKLATIDDDAFNGCHSLLNLSLSGTAITKLPVVGLEELQELNLEGTPSLTHLPPTVSYAKVTHVRVSYPQHCCAFKYPRIQDSYIYEQVKKKQDALRCADVHRTTPAYPDSPAIDESTHAAGGDESGSWSFGFFSRRLLGDSGSFGKFLGGWGDIATAKPASQRTPQLHGNWLDSTPSLVNNDKQRTVDPCSEDGWNLDLFREAHLTCTPAPNAFNPCVDVLEADWLRVLLWLVALLTLGGNMSVLAFTACTRSSAAAAPLTVGKFLVANLAVADLALVAHLIALAGEDAATRGEYFNHAIKWQQGGWCDAMGFVAVFGAELSVFTLCAVTLERWYAISHAINLTKRMRMRHAVAIMASGWLLSAAIAAAPLFDVSSYQVTSLCLPFRYDTPLDKGYIVFLLIINLGAFALVLCCYVSMFLQVRGSDAWSSSDAYIAKRMALLVFTDFICWGPVAIVAALSAGGIDVSLSTFSLSQLTHAKIVLAVFYPFNACANPFLYAILTKQFRKDVMAAMNRFGLCRWKLRYPAESLTTSHSSSPWHLPGSRGSSRRGRSTSATQPSAVSLVPQCPAAGTACSPHTPSTNGVKLQVGTDDTSMDSPGPESNRATDWFVHQVGSCGEASLHDQCHHHHQPNTDCGDSDPLTLHFQPVTRAQAASRHPWLELRRSSGGRPQQRCFQFGTASVASLDSRRRSDDASAATAHRTAGRTSEEERGSPTCCLVRGSGNPNVASDDSVTQLTLLAAPAAAELRWSRACQQLPCRTALTASSALEATATQTSLGLSVEACVGVAVCSSASAQGHAEGGYEQEAVQNGKLSAHAQGCGSRESGFYSLERQAKNESSPLLGRHREDVSSPLLSGAGDERPLASSPAARSRRCTPEPQCPPDTP